MRLLQQFLYLNEVIFLRKCVNFIQEKNIKQINAEIQYTCLKNFFSYIFYILSIKNRIVLQFSSFHMFQGEKNYGFPTQDKSWEQMSKTQRLQYSNNVKAKAAVMLIQATQFVQSKNYEKAKQLLVQIADSCNRVKDPDQQILKWIQISCSYLAMLHRNSQQKKLKSAHSLEKKRSKSHQNFIVLKYNKFSGEFQPDENQLDFVTQDVLKYVSRINMILFGCQNVQNTHSLYIMFTSYWIPFTIAFTLLVFAFIFLASQKIYDKKNQQMSQNFQIPALIIGALLIIPLFMIFFKALQQKDNTFFQKKLGQQIKRINQDCSLRKNKLLFMMPHGGQINVKIGKLESNDNENIQKDEVIQTPEDEFMKTIKGFTKQISKISGNSIVLLKA